MFEDDNYSEAQHLIDNGDFVLFEDDDGVIYSDPDDTRDLVNKNTHNQYLTRSIEAKDQYESNLNKSVGEKINCPWCKKLIVKTTYQKTFCTNTYRNNCKDKFWNAMRWNSLNPKKPVKKVKQKGYISAEVFLKTIQNGAL